MTHINLLLSFAQTEYLRKNKNKYEDWIRVIKNIVSRENITEDSTHCVEKQERDNIVNSYGFNNSIQLVKKLTHYCDDIYAHLAKENDITHLAEKIDLKLDLENTQIKEQLDEEIQKAKQIQKDPELKEIIHDIEDCGLAKGKISLVFEESIDKISKEDFEKRRVVLAKYFNKDIIKNNNDNDNEIIRRALLATPRYNPDTKEKEYDLFRWLWSSLSNLSNKKYHGRTIPELTDIIDILEKKNWRSSRIDGKWILSPEDWGKNYICNLFKALETKTPDEIIEDSKNNIKYDWLYRLITEKDLLKGKRYLAICGEDWESAYFTETKSPQNEESFKHNRI